MVTDRSGHMWWSTERREGGMAVLGYIAVASSCPSQFVPGSGLGRWQVLASMQGPHICSSCRPRRSSSIIFLFRIKFLGEGDPRWVNRDKKNVFYLNLISIRIDLYIGEKTPK